MNRLILSFLYLFFSGFATAQSTAVMTLKRPKVVIPFELIDNIMIVKASLNNVAVHLMLDTGSQANILFNAPENEKIKFSQYETIKIAGLGPGAITEGLLTKDNTLQLKGLTFTQSDWLLVEDESINPSSRMGIVVNGILGSDFFRQHWIHINYQNKKISVFENRNDIPKRYFKNYKPQKTSIENNRLFLWANTATFVSKLLLDTGLSDALWLFNPAVMAPNAKKITEYLGMGIGGEIMGYKTKINHFQLQTFSFEKIVTAIPDSSSIKNIAAKTRNGSIGGAILKRFSVLMSYKDNYLALQKNNAFDEPFLYNKSGMELMHDGLTWVKIPQKTRIDRPKNSLDGLSINLDSSNDISYTFSLKPIFRIAYVRPQSAADQSGLQKDDILVRINQKEAHYFTKKGIDEMLQNGKEGKTITFEIERKGVLKTFKMMLKEEL